MSSPDKIKPLLKNSLGVIINTAFGAVHSRRPVTLKQNVKQSLWLGADFFLQKSGFFSSEKLYTEVFNQAKLNFLISLGRI